MDDTERASEPRILCTAVLYVSVSPQYGWSTNGSSCHTGRADAEHNKIWKLARLMLLLLISVIRLSNSHRLSSIWDKPEVVGYQWRWHPARPHLWEFSKHIFVFLFTFLHLAVYIYLFIALHFYIAFKFGRWIYPQCVKSHLNLSGVSVGPKKYFKS